MGVAVPFRATTRAMGFMMAESAPIGRRSMSSGLATSTMMTSFFFSSRMQMYFSDSIVHVLKATLSLETPRASSCTRGQAKHGAHISVEDQFGGALHLRPSG